MQVSWIDPEEIRSLLAQIEGPLPRPAANNFAWELNTLPVMPMEPLAAENIVEGPALTQKASSSPPPPPPVADLPLSDQRSGPATGDLWRIRERLRSLREQAQESGILPRGEEPAEDQEFASPSETFEPLPPPTPEELAQVYVDEIDETSVELEPIQEAPEPPPAVEPHVPAFEALADEPMFSPAPPRVASAFMAPAPELTGEAAILPTPARVFNPIDLPAPMVPNPPTGPMTIEYSGPAPGSQEYEPLFSQIPPTPPRPAPAPTVPIEPMAMAEVSPFSIVEPEIDVTSGKPPFVVPPLGLSDRLSALAQWASERLGTGEVLLVDDYGDVLWGGHAQTPLVLSAMMAWHAAQRSTAESACGEPHRIDKDLANGRALTVLPARTRYGVISLAVIQDKSMSPEDEQAIRTALVLAVEGPE